MQRVLITGAAGNIGSQMRRLLAGRYPVLRLSDIAPLGEAALGEELDRTDLADFDAVLRMMQGVDGVLHLGGIPVEDSWQNILPTNIAGTYNVYEAARRQGVRRVVFASTNHVIGFYPRTQRIDHTAIPRPDSRYGVSKAFGESLASLYADKYGVETLAIRIGNVGPRPADARRLSIWISPRDFAQLVRIGLEAPDLHFRIVYGASATSRSWWDNSEAERLGYRPEDNADDYAEEVLRAEASKPKDPLAERFQGGPFVSQEFESDPSRL